MWSYWLLRLSIDLRLLVISLRLLSKTLLWLVEAGLLGIALRLRGIAWLGRIARLGLSIALRLLIITLLRLSVTRLGLGIALRLLIIALGLSVTWLSVARLRRIALILRCITLRLSVARLGFGPGNRAAF